MGAEQSKRSVNGVTRSPSAPPSPASSGSRGSNSSGTGAGGGVHSRTTSPNLLSLGHGRAISGSSSASPPTPHGVQMHQYTRPVWTKDGELHLPPCLEHLNMSSQAMTKREAHSLLRALADNKSIKYVNLANNKLGDTGVEVLAAMLATDALLERLDLSSNDLTDRGVAHLARAIAGNPKLALTDLRLAFNRLTDTSCSHLAQCVKSNATLMRVDCSGNAAITANGQHILAAMRSRPALVEAGKAVLSPARDYSQEEVQLTDASSSGLRGSVSAHTSPLHTHRPLSQHGRSTYTSPVAPAVPTSAFTMGAPSSDLHHAPANFSAPSTGGPLSAATDGDADSAFSTVPSANGGPRSRKGQAKQAELLSHERRVELDLDAQLHCLSQQKVETVSSQLLEQVFTILHNDDAQMSRFVELSVAFRQGSISVSSFYTYALESLRFAGLRACIPAMLIALHAVPEKQAQLKRAHIEYLCVKALLAEKQEAQARGESTLAETGVPTQSAHPPAPGVLDVLHAHEATAPASDEGQVDTPVFSKLAEFPSQQQQQQQHAPPLFPPTPQATVLPPFTAQPQQQHDAPVATTTVATSSPAPAAARILPASALSDAAPTPAATASVTAPAVPTASAAAAPRRHSLGASVGTTPSSTSAPPSPAVTAAAVVIPADLPDTSVQYQFLKERAARAEREAAAAEKKRQKEEAIQAKKAEEAARKQEEARKKEEALAAKRAAEAEALAARRAAEAIKAAAAETERVKRAAEKAEKARHEQERREQEEAAARAREAKLAAARAAQAEAAARAAREAEAVAAAEAAARAAREEEERAARRARRTAELEEAARIAAAEAARQAEAQAAEAKRARREAREAEKERARIQAEEEAAREAAAAEAAVARKREREQEKLRRLMQEAAEAAAVAAADAAAAEADRITLLEETEGTSLPTDPSGSVLSAEDREAKRLRKEEKRLKRTAKEARRLEREKLAAQQPQPQAPPPPTQFHSPPPMPSAAAASAASQGPLSNEPADVVARWAASYTAQLPAIFVPPPPPPLPEVAVAASNSFIPYEDEVKLQRQEAAKRARIAALHVAYAQAQADAAKRDRDQAAIKPDVLPLLLNLHVVFPPLDESGRPQPNTPYPFSLALQSDSSPSAIKKSFLKASVAVHPDKQAKSDAQRVQLSSLIFPILRDSYQHYTSKL